VKPLVLGERRRPGEEIVPWGRKRGGDDKREVSTRKKRPASVPSLETWWGGGAD